MLRGRGRRRSTSTSRHEGASEGESAAGDGVLRRSIVPSLLRSSCDCRRLGARRLGGAGAGRRAGDGRLRVLPADSGCGRARPGDARTPLSKLLKKCCARGLQEARSSRSPCSAHTRAAGHPEGRSPPAEDRCVGRGRGARRSRAGWDSTPHCPSSQTEHGGNGDSFQGRVLLRQGGRQLLLWPGGAASGAG